MWCCSSAPRLFCCKSFVLAEQWPELVNIGVKTKRCAFVSTHFLTVSPIALGRALCC